MICNSEGGEFQPRADSVLAKACISFSGLLRMLWVIICHWAWFVLIWSDKYYMLSWFFPVLGCLWTVCDIYQWSEAELLLSLDKFILVLFLAFISCSYVYCSIFSSVSLISVIFIWFSTYKSSHPFNNFKYSQGFEPKESGC